MKVPVGFCLTPQKLGFRTREAAMNRLHKERREGRKKFLPVRPYECACGKWHLVYKPRRVRK